MKEELKADLEQAFKHLAAAKNIQLANINELLVLEQPPERAMGDIAIPLFAFAKIFKLAPATIAKEIEKILAEKWKTRVIGPYLNLFEDRASVIPDLLEKILREEDDFGRNDSLRGAKICIEFSSPNTNKPLHLGHLRNNILGECLARLMQYSGAHVYKVNIINNRGVHICKSMLAYKKFGRGQSPESTNMKGDHFVGNYYQRYNEWAKEEPEIEGQIHRLLEEWETGKPEVLALWEQMNAWAMAGILETYQRTDISFDKLYFESDTYKMGNHIVDLGIRQGIFEQAEDSSVSIDLRAENLGTKVLRRSNGTSVYMTQDLGTAIARHDDFAFDQMVYVVGSEQEYHFEVLFVILKKLAYNWADKLKHLSYGMVQLPNGKMKSREGTTVDADDLLDDLEELALEKMREQSLANKDIAHKIALGALHYYLLQFNPGKDILFNPAESLALTGNTGPYLQYVCARINSILARYELIEEQLDRYQEGYYEYFKLLSLDVEWSLLKALEDFPRAVEQAAKTYNPLILINNMYDIGKSFSRFYHDAPILNLADKELKLARIYLCKSTLLVLRNGFKLTAIPYLDKM